MKIISERELIEGTDYQMVFYRNTRRSGSAFSFNCDKSGKLEPIKYQEGQANYDRCLKGFDERNGETILPGVLEEREFSYWNAAVGKCDCGSKVHLANFTNTCDCGADYNSAGQRLADRSQWGEETGEHWTECY